MQLPQSIVDKLTVEERREVAVAAHTMGAGRLAAAYVWGRQDAGDGDVDSAVAWHFSTAFAEWSRLFDIEQVCYFTNAERAWQLWKRHGFFSIYRSNGGWHAKDDEYNHGGAWIITADFEGAHLLPVPAVGSSGRDYWQD